MGTQQHKQEVRAGLVFNGALAFIGFAGNCLLPTSIHDDLALNRILGNIMPR
jgi:hypothetical protein